MAVFAVNPWEAYLYSTVVVPAVCMDRSVMRAGRPKGCLSMTKGSPIDEEGVVSTPYLPGLYCCFVLIAGIAYYIM